MSGLPQSIEPSLPALRNSQNMSEVETNRILICMCAFIDGIAHKNISKYQKNYGCTGKPRLFFRSYSYRVLITKMTTVALYLFTYLKERDREVPCVGSCLLLSQDVQCSKLESGTELGLDLRHPDVRCGFHRWWCLFSAQLPAPLLI